MDSSGFREGYVLGFIEHDCDPSSWITRVGFFDQPKNCYLVKENYDPWI